MDEQVFQNKMNELLEKIRTLPIDQRHELESMADAARDHREGVTTTVDELQESLDYLRLSVKYLVFDLEATRRENAYLRKLVEQWRRDNSRPHGSQDDFCDEDDGAE
jgi:hypothetical protein